ncbi:hypothetical protein [Devosia naphthalenivorans]|uniref:hypothetical protein n=1 Tax=Devosia naphthalenivorans TaxID=2082392 RepID=UPI000D341C69|nr:hypothetical protein [Devosia naphthalenivorans]
MIVNKSMYPLQTSFGVISKMQDKFATLQMQLGTGEKSSTLAGMGRDLPLSLSVRSRLDKIEGYSANIETVNLRLSFLDKTLTRFDKLEGEARNAAIQGQYGTGGINMATLPGLSKARFDEIVTMLNEDVAGRYLFGGTATDKAPLRDTETLLNGAGGKYGFKRVSELRAKADGVDDAHKLGRLQLPTPASDTVSLSEDGDHVFGLKLSNATTTASSSAIVITPPDVNASPATLNVQFVGQPTPGQSIAIGLTLPDGNETQVTLTASSDSSSAPGSFLVSDDLDEMAANFAAALKTGLEVVTQTELKAGSTFAAANDFFNESGIPKLPLGDPATELEDDTTGLAIRWYTGDTAANPRATVSSNIDDTARVNYGMQANESGFLRLIRSQAALAISEYPSEEAVRSKDMYEDLRLAAMALPEGADRDVKLAEYNAAVTADYRLSTGFFDGMAKRQQSELSESHNTETGSIEIITMEIGLAQGTLQSATTRHTDYKAQLDNLLSDIETVSKEDVAMEILALQTRLQASFQTTAMVSQLSLVNFL